MKIAAVTAVGRKGRYSKIGSDGVYKLSAADGMSYSC